jgi:hypothetical protein
MIATLSVLLTVVLVSLSLRVWARRAQRDAALCAACGGEPALVCAAGDGPNLTYDVTCCPVCATAATRVAGAPHPLGWCPACHHHTLALHAQRLPGPATAVAVEEHCDHCGHARAFEVRHGAPSTPSRFATAPQGRVLAFPADRVRAVAPRPEPAGALVSLTPPSGPSAPPAPPSRAHDQRR